LIVTALGSGVFSCLVPAASAQAEQLTVLNWNIYTYDDPGSPAYEALVRVVQALNPQIILFQEANNSTGRGAFAVEFAAAYPYSFLGAPSNGHARNQILSAYPLTHAGEIFTDDPYYGGVFERPTVWADVDVLTGAPGAELRVYSVHYKAGSEARDYTLRLNQATDDANHITAAVTADPDLYVIYAGDCNAEVGDPPIDQILDPQTTMSRRLLIDPNTGADHTRCPPYTRTIDHVFASATLGGSFTDEDIFQTSTFVPAELPPPAQSDDTCTASDHLALVVTLDLGPRVSADFDFDKDVDNDDFAHLAECLNGANAPLLIDCDDTDLDLDLDTDQSDFGLFQRCLSGRNIDADPDCLG
jgi:endonuclease/exonuclease/phosphatase family metal-dependent hydrolase